MKAPVVKLALLVMCLNGAHQARANSAPTNATPLTGISLTNTCNGVHTPTLRRRFELEIATARSHEKGTDAEIIVSCADLQITIAIHRHAPKPPISRSFDWQGETRQQPERWLALAIHQSLVDAGIVESRNAQAPMIDPEPQAIDSRVAAPRLVAFGQTGWRVMGVGASWSGPSVAAGAIGGRGSLGWLLRLGFAQGERARQLGDVRVQALEAISAFAVRKRLTTRASARVWLGGGVIYVNMQGRSESPTVRPSTVSGLGGVFDSGVGADWRVGQRLTIGLAAGGGYVVGTARGRVRGDEPVNGFGPWVGVTFNVGVAL